MDEAKSIVSIDMASRPNLTFSAPKLKSYVGLKSAERKLEKWLSDFEFIDISTTEKVIDWNTVNKISL